MITPPDRITYISARTTTIRSEHQLQSDSYRETHVVCRVILRPPRAAEPKHDHPAGQDYVHLGQDDDHQIGTSASVRQLPRNACSLSRNPSSTSSRRTQA